ncbi:hypothetical protein JAAARDRAFT_57608 [Jaapia argillacea MUCL 33604]|uniref:Uncharacterized protein n=1 Tax=Jaapia argillacea MUCL 33604 TaxID=933084 RepID=A0A067Q7Z3_9AGAM|nr:hypothetical protein JAAARDRAFT_57608 [Jaapia argillacea MUCL 33604]
MGMKDAKEKDQKYLGAWTSIRSRLTKSFVEISVKVQLRSAPGETADSIEVTVGQSTGINGVLFVLATYNKVEFRKHPHFYALGGSEKSLEKFHLSLKDRVKRDTASLSPLDLDSPLDEYKDNPLVVLSERKHRVPLDCDVSPRIIGNIWRADDTYLVKDSAGVLSPVETVNKEHKSCSSIPSAGGSRDDNQPRAAQGHIGEEDHQTRPEDDLPRAEDDQPGVVAGETTNMIVAPEWESVLRATEAPCILACRPSLLAPTPDGKKDEDHFDKGMGRRRPTNLRITVIQQSTPQTSPQRFSMLRSAVPVVPTTASAQQAPQLPTAYPSSAPKHPQLPDVNQSGTPRAVPDVALPQPKAHLVSEHVVRKSPAVNPKERSSVEIPDKSPSKPSAAKLEPPLTSRVSLPASGTMSVAFTSSTAENPSKSLARSVVKAQDSKVVELGTETVLDSMMHNNPVSFSSRVNQDGAIGEYPRTTTQGDSGTAQIFILGERNVVPPQKSPIPDHVAVPEEPAPPPVLRPQPPTTADTNIDTGSSTQKVGKKGWWQRVIVPVADKVIRALR